MQQADTAAALRLLQPVWRNSGTAARRNSSCSKAVATVRLPLWRSSTLATLSHDSALVQRRPASGYLPKLLCLSLEHASDS